MNISKKLLARDPSRFVVYEMIENIQKEGVIKPFSLETDKMFLFKTKPYTNHLYNYVHFFSGNINEDDWRIIKDFFAGDSFRIKLEENRLNEDFLLKQGLKYKSLDHSAELDEIDPQNLKDLLGRDHKIKIVSDSKTLDDFKQIICSAFSYQATDYQARFDFLDSFLLDKNYNKIKAFVLYRAEKAVSTGLYYSFSNFSIENIGTLPEERGRGYAGLMVAHLLEEARALGHSKACLVSSESGISVYKKRGFKEIAKELTYIKD